jgi:hypothetical protein
MDHQLSLSEKYLDVLDGLDAGAEEWKVINALKEPQPAREVAASVDLPDFRVCQILWTLRVLRAIELGSLDARVVEDREPAESISVDVVDLDRPPVVAEEPAEEPVAVHVADEEPVAAVEDPDESSTEIPVHEQTDEQVEIEVMHAETDERDLSDAADDTPDETVRVALDESDVDEDSDVEVEVLDTEPEEEPVFAAETAAGDAPIEDPHLRELEESTRTMRLSREEVDAALQTPPDDAIDGPDAWQPPVDLEQSISRFNAMQRLIYRTVRSEVGAGAANFIRACCDDDAPSIVEDIELQSDGTWDNEGLRRQVVENRIANPWESYRQLIDRELDVLRTHVGEAKIIELQREVDKASETHAP